MTDAIIQLANFDRDFEKIRAIRVEVFQREQGVAAELEFDGADPQAEHFLAYVDQIPVGTLRLRYLAPLDQGWGKIERLAVLAPFRRQGIGQKLMEVALERLRDQGCGRAIVHAQTYIQDFYLRLGFGVQGDPFEEAHILHLKMEKILRP